MTPNLPARPTTAHGPTGVPLSQTPTEALCFALGYIAARPVSADQFGGVTALVEELMRRNMRADSFDRWTDPAADGSVWNALFSFMPPELARGLQTLYFAHRGQRWARTGNRHGDPAAGRPSITGGDPRA